MSDQYYSRQNIAVQGVEFPDGTIAQTGVKRLRVIVTSAQIKTIGTTPIVLVPGVVGYAPTICSPIAWLYDFGGVDYVDPSSGQAQFGVGLGSTPNDIINNSPQATRDFAVFMGLGITFGVITSLSGKMLLNGGTPATSGGSPLSVVCYNSTDGSVVNPTTGNGTMIIDFLYRLVAVV